MLSPLIAVGAWGHHLWCQWTSEISTFDNNRQMMSTQVVTRVLGFGWLQGAVGTEATPGQTSPAWLQQRLVQHCGAGQDPATGGSPYLSHWWMSDGVCDWCRFCVFIWVHVIKKLQWANVESEFGVHVVSVDVSVLMCGRTLNRQTATVGIMVATVGIMVATIAIVVAAIGTVATIGIP